MRYRLLTTDRIMRWLGAPQKEPPRWLSDRPWLMAAALCALWVAAQAVAGAVAP